MSMVGDCVCWSRMTGRGLGCCECRRTAGGGTMVWVLLRTFRLRMPATQRRAAPSGSRGRRSDCRTANFAQNHSELRESCLPGHWNSTDHAGSIVYLHANRFGRASRYFAVASSFLASHAFIWAISASCALMTSSASLRTSASLPCSSATFAIATAP